jgi:epsilon-lactone hydrolase
MVGHIAKAAGIRALNVDYRLAPEHPHPAAVEDSVTAYRWLLDQALRPEHLAIAGDSAGGGLTIATLVALRDRGLPLPAAAVPISPWVDLEGTGATMATKADVDLLVSAEVIKSMADSFLAGQDARDPLAAPLHAELSGLPPMYIQVGDDETLLDDSRRIAERARGAGVDVRLDVFPEMQHVFQMTAGNVPEADDAIARIGAYLRERLTR